MSEKNKRVRVFREASFEFPRTLSETVVWLAELLEGIPEVYRDSAEIELDHNEYSCDLEISYLRPETYEEQGARMAQDAEYADRQKQRDLKALADLKAKYEAT